MARWFHVSSALNRDSIRAHGLDVTRMGRSRGIAGSAKAEAAGVFLCRDRGEADWFVAMNNTGGPVDVWAVDGIDPATLLDNGSGLLYLPGAVVPGDVTLVEPDASI